jgi:hypothetical protein
MRWSFIIEHDLLLRFDQHTGAVGLFETAERHRDFVFAGAHAFKNMRMEDGEDPVTGRQVDAGFSFGLFRGNSSCACGPSPRFHVLTARLRYVIQYVIQYVI